MLQGPRQRHFRLQIVKRQSSKIHFTTVYRLHCISLYSVSISVDLGKQIEHTSRKVSLDTSTSHASPSRCEGNEYSDEADALRGSLRWQQFPLPFEAIWKFHRQEAEQKIDSGCFGLEFIIPKSCKGKICFRDTLR